jgi:GDP-mannose 6-dehydrogenase
MRQSPRGRTPSGVSIFGLGYVGCVNAAGFSAWGHTVIGVDVNPAKVDEILKGGSPIVEPGLNELIRTGVRRGRLTATTRAAEAVKKTAVSFVCVGTPGEASGRPRPDYIQKVCAQIGRVLKTKRGYHLIAIRCTSLPGTVERAARIIGRASGKKEGSGFGVCSHPEFLREGTAVSDFRKPPFTIVGVRRPRDGEIMKRLYGSVPGEFIETDVEVAEMIKYTSNAYHAVKVTFANEIGALCRSAGVDSHKVMEIFARDTKLNVSRAYLKPGFAFGGSCLPKDIRALSYMARSRHLTLPLLASAVSSNEEQIRALLERIAALGEKRVGILGLAFKSGTDDLRESPMVRVVEWLIGKGYQVRIFDPNVQLSRLIGANRAFIEKEIPHIASLMAEDAAEVVRDSRVILVGNREDAYLGALKNLKRNQRVIDLVGLLPPGAKAPGRWEGLYW